MGDFTHPAVTAGVGYHVASWSFIAAPSRLEGEHSCHAVPWFMGSLAFFWHPYGSARLVRVRTVQRQPRRVMTAAKPLKPVRPAPARLVLAPVLAALAPVAAVAP